MPVIAYREVDEDGNEIAVGMFGYYKLVVVRFIIKQLKKLI